MSSTIRVFICDDHLLFREGVKAVLRSNASLDIVGEASNGRQAVEKIKDLRPDIVLMDVAMPDLPGFEATAQIREFDPAIKVVIVSMNNSHELLTRCLESGASGYVAKDASVDELVAAIRSVHRGEEYFSRSVLQEVVSGYVENYRPPQTPYERLSGREREILALLAEGLTVRETATRLNLSAKTVDVHKYNLMRKINVHDRSALVRYAVEEQARRVRRW